VSVALQAHSRVFGGDGPYGINELVRLDVFEQEPAGASAQSGEGVLVDVEGVRMRTLVLRRVVAICRVASTSSIRGMRTSMRTHP
jgi:hypothetical protein